MKDRYVTREVRGGECEVLLLDTSDGSERLVAQLRDYGIEASQVAEILNAEAARLAGNTTLSDRVAALEAWRKSATEGL